nr:deoxyribose-phosphate aldolase [Zhaonella formicivorans]
MMNREELAGIIDHTLLKPEATARDIEKLCLEAREHGFYSVCINPCYVKRAADFLADSKVKVCTVIGFPLGATTWRQKQAEAEEAVASGAHELDMVIALGALKGGEWGAVRKDLAAVRQAAGKGVILKVILETALLTSDELEQACIIAEEEGADFVKTSTGFLGPGATVEAVTLMRKSVGPSVGVKASGGIRTLKQLLEMVEAGANRIGTSSGVKIMEELPATKGLPAR